jgi:hypothetical protein
VACARLLARRERGERQETGAADAEQRHAPAEGAADTEAHDRGGRIAQAAADAVHAVGVSEPARVDIGIEHGEVRRMEDAVAHAHQRHQWKQPIDAWNEGGDDQASGQNPDAAEQDGPGAETIDGESGGELAGAARHVEHAYQRPERRVADTEFCLEQRKQRRQRELEKVRQAVRRADQPDHPGIAAERPALGDGRSGSQGLKGAKKLIIACTRFLPRNAGGGLCLQRLAPPYWVVFDSPGCLAGSWPGALAQGLRRCICRPRSRRARQNGRRS